MNSSVTMFTKTFLSCPVFPRAALAWIFPLTMFGVIEIKAQEKLYGKYTELPITEKYQLESMSPRLVGGKIEELTEREKKEVLGRNRSKRTAIAEDKRRVETVLESGGDLADPIVTSFFKGYVFAEMTQLGDETFDKLSNLGNLRSEFLKNYLSPKLNGAARQRFIDTICLPQLKIIYSDSQIHPAARLSAIYLLGMLDVVPGSRSPVPAAPTPSPKALEQLLLILKDQSAEPFLKVGAWAGLQRHVEIDAAAAGSQIAGPLKTQIKQAAIQFIDGNFDGQDKWEADLSYWMKRRSTQMLGILKDQADLPKIVAVLSNSDYGIWLRLDALEAIEKMALKTVDAQVVTSIGKFLAEGIAAEAKWLNEAKEQLIYDNLLYEDVDLEVTGTNWNDDPNIVSGGGGMGRGGREGGGREGRGGGRFGGGGMGDMGMGGLGGGMDMGGGSGREGRGGGGGGLPTSGETDHKFVELPNYLLNVSRRRIKSLAFIGKRVLMPVQNQGLHQAADPATKDKIVKMIRPLDKVLKDSDVGLINLAIKKPRTQGLEDPLDEADAPKKSITEQLMEACTTASNSLKAIVQPEEKKDANPLGS